MAIIRSGETTDQWTIDPVSKAGRVTLYDYAGNAIKSEYNNGNYYLGASILQDVHSSSLNSSELAIVNAQTWSGDSESTTGIAGIQVNTFIDRPHTVTVYQAGYNGHWDIIDSWTVPASFGVSRTIQATGLYFKVTVRNNGASTSTVTRICTTLCPIVESLPRSLTQGGNLRVSVAADWQSADRTTGLYALSSFRTLGINSSPQNIFTIENPAASLIAIAIRGLSIISESLALLATISPQIKLSRTTGLPTGGTTLTAVKYKTDYAESVGICRGGTASDGGGASAITATAGSTIWGQFLDRPETEVGYNYHPNYSMIPDVGADLRQLILLPGEGLLVEGVTAIPTTTHLVVNASWLEYKYL